MAPAHRSAGGDGGSGGLTCGDLPSRGVERGQQPAATHASGTRAWRRGVATLRRCHLYSLSGSWRHGVDAPMLGRLELGADRRDVPTDGTSLSVQQTCARGRRTLTAPNTLELHTGTLELHTGTAHHTGMLQALQARVSGAGAGPDPPAQRQEAAFARSGPRLGAGLTRRVSQGGRLRRCEEADSDAASQDTRETRRRLPPCTRSPPTRARVFAASRLRAWCRAWCSLPCTLARLEPIFGPGCKSTTTAAALSRLVQRAGCGAGRSARIGAARRASATRRCGSPVALPVLIGRVWAAHTLLGEDDCRSSSASLSAPLSSSPNPSSFGDDAW